MQRRRFLFGRSDSYLNRYFTIHILESNSAGIFTLYRPSSYTSLAYSINNGSWVDFSNNEETNIDVEPNDEIRIKAVCPQYARQYQSEEDFLYSSMFNTNLSFNVSGNIMSLLCGDNYANKKSLAECNIETFAGLLYTQPVVSAKNLVLPAIILKQQCYSNMFYKCTSLTTAPELPATTLAERCYQNMFRVKYDSSRSVFITDIITNNYNYILVRESGGSD